MSNPQDLTNSTPIFDLEEHLRKAEVATSRKSFKRAAMLYSEVLERMPESVDALYGVGVVELRQDRAVVARSYLQKALGLAECSAADSAILAVIESSLGLAAFQMYDVRGAIAHWQRSHELNADANVAAWIEELAPIAPIMISVIMYTSEHAHILRAAVKAVYRQSYKNLEVIVVDDASSDDTAAAIAELRDYFGFEYLKLTDKVGSSEAIDIALTRCRGEYFIALDAFDCMPPDTLSTYLNERSLERTAVGEIGKFRQLRPRVPNVAVERSIDRKSVNHPVARRHRDLVIGLGPVCQMAWTIRKYFGTSTAYPFDWWVTPTETMLRMIQPSFRFEVQMEDLVEVPVFANTPTPDWSVYNKKLHLLHHHDFDRGGRRQGMLNVADTEKMNSKYRMLFDRLHDGVTKAQRPIFAINNILHSLDSWNSHLEGMRYVPADECLLTDDDVIRGVRTVFGEKSFVLIVSRGFETTIKHYEGGVHVQVMDNGWSLPSTPNWVYASNIYYRALEMLDVVLREQS